MKKHSKKIKIGLPGQPQFHLFYVYDAANEGEPENIARTHLGSFNTKEELLEEEKEVIALIREKHLPLDEINHTHIMSGEIEVEESELQYSFIKPPKDPI